MIKDDRNSASAKQRKWEYLKIFNPNQDKMNNFGYDLRIVNLNYH